MRVFLVVLDSVGIGAAPDASVYGDAGSNTLAHIAQHVGGLNLPTLSKMGLGNISSVIPTGLPLQGVDATESPIASFGAMHEKSSGKDTTTGHWEMAGILLSHGFQTFPPEYPSLPQKLISDFEELTGRRVICNRAASGTAIIEELGKQQMEEGVWIVYTSADSVFQVAAHEDIIPLEELYSACEKARTLCNKYHIGRVIARPFIGQPGAFVRTENRHDYSFPIPEPTILSILSEKGLEVITVGKLDDIFPNSGITQSFHVENNPDAQSALSKLVKQDFNGLIFANLIDFDMLYGHRRDPAGYAKALEATDLFLTDFISDLKDDDVLMITADHGNDPTFKGTDHTREYVPLLCMQPGVAGKTIGIREGFFDIAQSIATFFKIEPMPRGVSFL